MKTLYSTAVLGNMERYRQKNIKQDHLLNFSVFTSISQIFPLLHKGEELERVDLNNKQNNKITNKEIPEEEREKEQERGNRKSQEKESKRRGRNDTDICGIKYIH